MRVSKTVADSIGAQTCQLISQKTAGEFSLAWTTLNSAETCIISKAVNVLSVGHSHRLISRLTIAIPFT